MKNQFEIEGYHGTFKDNVHKIIEEGYTFSRRENHWLGQGIYFYEDIELAKWFITRKYNKKYRKQISVIKSILNTASDKVLDLDTNDGVDFVYKALKELINEIKIEFNIDDETTNRCIILDIIKEYYSIDIIKMTFKTNNQSYGGANIKFFEENYFPVGIYYSETQICATDNKCIKHSIEIDCSRDFKFPDKVWFKKNKKR